MNDRDLEGLVSELKHGRISRRQFMERALVMGLAVGGVATVLAACGEGETATTASPSPTLPPMGEAGDKLRLFNWANYMAPATPKQFREQTGITVIETNYDSNEDMLAKLKAGGKGYDVIVPSDYMVHILLKTGLVEPLDMSAIPNFQYVGEKFREPNFDDPKENGGAKYSVPYEWGQTGVAQRLDKQPTPITKWADLWNPSYKQQINMLNDERETVGVGLMKVTGDVESINSTDQATIDKATDELIAQKPLVRAYDSASMHRNIVDGVPFVHCWNGDIILALDTGDVEPSQLTLIAPEEGIPMFVDNFCIPVGNQNRNGAHQFLNFMLDPEIAAANGTWVGYYSPIPDAVPIIKENNPNVYRYAPTDEEIATRGQFYQDLGAVGALYTQAWQTVKSS